MKKKMQRINRIMENRKCKAETKKEKICFEIMWHSEAQNEIIWGGKKREMLRRTERKKKVLNAW